MEAGQKVWFINHVNNRVEAGELISPDNISGRDEHPTLEDIRQHNEELRRLSAFWR